MHIDSSNEDVMETIALVKYGETVARPERCRRVWLGASDIAEEVSGSLSKLVY